MLSGGKKRVYGKGLSQLLPSDASALAKNIAYVLLSHALSHASGSAAAPWNCPPDHPLPRPPRPTRYHAEFSTDTTSLSVDKKKARGAPRGGGRAERTPLQGPV